MNKIFHEIEEKRREIHTDSYPMSIGEVSNLYRDDELDIHPEFQRVYRWTNEQKTKLIESILLGIPLPSFFMGQREDGVWDVIDGVQRLSTIFNFMGLYKDEHGKVLPPLKLTKTEYLNLDGLTWNDFPKDQQITFKREKIDLKIVKKESDRDTKFDLFQRLNTGGSQLSNQEVRNCMLIMLGINKFEWLKSLAQTSSFVNCIPLTERSLKEKYDMELVLRFVVCLGSTPASRKPYADISDYMTDQMRVLIFDEKHIKLVEKLFIKTFNLFESALGEDSFRRYDNATSTFKGPFVLGLFELFAIGYAKYLDQNGSELNTLDLEEKVMQVDHLKYKEFTKPGTRGMNRFPKLIKFGAKYFKNEN
jgi:hypothetical protein